MTSQEFKSLVKTWMLYHNLSPVKNVATLDEWYRGADKIPSESVEWILDRGKNGDPPRNIPALCWQLYREWRQAHPEKCAPKAYEGPACSNPWCQDGLMHVGKNDERARWIVYAFRCGVCRRGEGAFPFATPGELTESGYEIDTVEATAARFRMRFGDSPRNKRGEIDWRKMATGMMRGAA